MLDGRGGEAERWKPILRRRFRRAMAPSRSCFVSWKWKTSYGNAIIIAYTAVVMEVGLSWKMEALFGFSVA